MTDIILHSEEDTTQFAKIFSKYVEPYDVIYLRGDLGTGKSFFVRQVIKAMDPEHDEVPSPTYTLVQSYEVGDNTIWHFDLYRLEEFEDIFNIDLEEALYGTIFIEWPELLGHYDLGGQKLEIQFQMGDETHTRILTLTGDISWHDRIGKIIDEYRNTTSPATSHKS